MARIEIMRIYNKKGEAITPCNKNGEPISVVSSMQSLMETTAEIKRAKFFEKVSLLELCIIIALLIWKIAG